VQKVKRYSTTFLQLSINLLMRLFFRLLYQPLAWMYDLVALAVSFGRWFIWGRAAAQLARGEHILELGFGTGHLQEYLHDPGRRVFGLDESRQMAAIARRRLLSRGISPCLVRGRAQALPFPNRHFDCLLAAFPTLYIIDPQTLAEIARVLKPGGRLVVLMAAWASDKTILGRAMNWLFRVTGQSPAEDLEIDKWVAPYRQAGFKTGIRLLDQNGSRLLVIIAETTTHFV
jgi:ubiquinone/menaquinone biosynthesis C-methylase UbiE